MTKKGLSPLIAVVILVGLAVTVSGLVSSWLGTFVTESTTSSTCVLNTIYTMSGTTYDTTTGQIKTKIKNAGTLSIYNFTFEADNGTDIATFPASAPSATVRITPGQSQYVKANASLYNITNINTITLLVKSCPGYAPSAVSVENI